MSPGLHDFSRIVERIYGAALDPSEWRDVVPEVLRFVGAARGVLGIESGDGSGLRVSLSSELDPEILERWAVEFNGFDPVHERRGVPPAGLVFRSWSVVPRDETHRMDVYRACYGPMGLDDHLVAILTPEAEGGCYFTAFRAEHESTFSQDEEQRMRLVAPHLTRAVRIARTIGQLDLSLFAALENLPYAVATLGSDGKIASSNRACEALARANDGIAIRQGRLSTTLASEGARLEAAIRRASAVALGQLGTSTALRIARPSGLPPYQLLAVPLPEGLRGNSLAPFADTDLCAVFIRDQQTATRVEPRRLNELFQLTPTLANLASALAAGKTVVQYADEAGVAVGTARQQLKELLARTGTSRQAVLVGLLVSSVAALGRER